MLICLCLFLDFDECVFDLKFCFYGEICINGDGFFFCLNIMNDKGIIIFVFSVFYNRLNICFYI